MDWIKLLFFLNLTVLNVYFVKANNSQKEKLLKEEKTNFNHKASNSTQDEKETLEESPSGVIRFERPKEKAAFTNKKYKEKSSTEKESNRGTKNFEDLAKEANWHSPVLTFTEIPMGGYWQGVSQIIPHIEQTDFISPVPIIKSHSFINTPKMSSVQISYPPTGKLDGRHAYASREYPDDYNSQEGQEFPESENYPGRGHDVHTETTHDYGRFLSVDYKSKLEKEAEALIKQKRTQNTTTTTTTVRPLITTESRRRPQSSYRKPLNKSFFYKGGFDDAYPFETEKNQDDQRYVYSSEEYPNPQSTYASKAPVTSVAVEPFAPRPPITSTEAYQQQYNYPREHLPQHNHHNKDSHHISSHNEDDSYKSPPRKNSYYRDKNHGNDYHKNSDYDARDRYYVDVHNKGSQHEDPSYKGQYNVDSSPKTTHYETENVRDPYNSERPHKHQQHGNFHHKNPSSGEFHHTGPPNAPAQYDSSAEKYSSTNPDTFQKSFSHPYSEEAPHSPYQYNKPEEFHPRQYNDGKQLMPPYNSNFNQPIHQTDPSPNEHHQPYSNMPPPKPPVSYPDSSQHAKSSTLDLPSSGPLQKTPEEEKTYYNTVKSLVDLYKSFGLQPFNLDDVPYALPVRFAFGNTFDVGAGPTPNTGSSKDFIPNHKVQSYTENKNTPRDQNLNNYHKPHLNANYKSQENEPNNARFKHSPPDRSKYFPHPEQNPYDGTRVSTVSTEHFDSSESPRPDLISTQGESPIESYFGDGIDFKHHSNSQNNKFSHTDDEKIQGIRIKDYDPKTFFGDSKQKNYDSSQESDFISSVSHSDGTKHPHSIVRQNPYNIYPEEVRTTFRPRVYKQNIHVQSTPSISDSVEKANDFYSNEEISEFSPPNDAYNSPHTISNSPRNNRHFNPGANHNENSQNAYNNPRSNILQKQNEHLRPQSERKHKYRFEQNENDRYHGHRENRQNRRKKTAHNHNRKKPSDFRQTEQRSKSYKDSDVQQKRHGKRHSQRHPRNLKPTKKSHGDYLRSESSTHHWGMEKHKEKDGFFQYANAPAAKAFEYGYRMGGPDQTQEKHHQTMGIQSKIKVNWEDKNGDSGDHYWEFNHNSDEAEEDAEEQNSKLEEYLKRVRKVNRDE